MCNAASFLYNMFARFSSVAKKKIGPSKLMYLKIYAIITETPTASFQLSILYSVSHAYYLYLV